MHEHDIVQSFLKNSGQAQLASQHLQGLARRKREKYANKEDGYGFKSRYSLLTASKPLELLDSK
jgi:hypothetical protein